MRKRSDSNTTTDKAKPLEIEFSNKAVIKEMEALPERVRDQFLVSLEMLSWGVKPELKLTHLSTVGPGIIELKINGSPAYRVVYSTKFLGKLVVLAARPKTAEGKDKKLIEAVTSRLKDYSGK